MNKNNCCIFGVIPKPALFMALCSTGLFCMAPSSQRTFRPSSKSACLRSQTGIGKLRSVLNELTLKVFACFCPYLCSLTQAALFWRQALTSWTTGNIWEWDPKALLLCSPSRALAGALCLPHPPPPTIDTAYLSIHRQLCRQSCTVRNIKEQLTSLFH